MSRQNEMLAGLLEEIDVLKGRKGGAQAPSLSAIRLGEVVGGGPRRWDVSELSASGGALALHEGCPAAGGMSLSIGDTVLLMFFDGMPMPLLFAGGSGSGGGGDGGGIAGYIGFFSAG